MSATAVSPAIEARASDVVGFGWPIEARVMKDAAAQARPFAGVTAEDRAWSARFEAAFHSMDVLDPAGLDVWMQAHATSPVPHELEAVLVAAWETHLASALTAEPSAPPAPMTAPQTAQGIACSGCEVPFAPVADPEEAEFLAGIHNRLHHAGRPEAAPTNSAASTHHEADMNVPNENQEQSPTAKPAVPERSAQVEPELVCPECEEPVQQRSPTALQPDAAPTPEWSHLDGEPLCPVMTDHGYAPAVPVPAEAHEDEAELAEMAQAWVEFFEPIEAERTWQQALDAASDEDVSYDAGGNAVLLRDPQDILCDSENRTAAAADDVDAAGWE